MTEEVVDALERTVLGVDGVASLHAGVFGEVGTYLPGRRVAGIVQRAESTEIHVAVLAGADVLDVAEAVRAAATDIVDGPVHVVVEDIVTA